MPTGVEIGGAGERIVDAALAAMGYHTNLNTRQPGSTDIEAAGSQVSLLVQVKTAVAPAVPSDMSSDEVRNIKARAAKLAYQAWQAKVSVDGNLKLVGEIVWKRLDE